jgi:hypothetical protein
MMKVTLHSGPETGHALKQPRAGAFCAPIQRRSARPMTSWGRHSAQS